MRVIKRRIERGTDGEKWKQNQGTEQGIICLPPFMLYERINVPHRKRERNRATDRHLFKDCL